MVHFTGLLENARPPPAGPCRWTLSGDPCKNCLPARIGGWPGTATGGQIHVVHISHTHPPKELIQALRKYLLGKKNTHKDEEPRGELKQLLRVPGFLSYVLVLVFIFQHFESIFAQILMKFSRNFGGRSCREERSRKFCAYQSETPRYSR